MIIIKPLYVLKTVERADSNDFACTLQGGLHVSDWFNPNGDLLPFHLFIINQHVCNFYVCLTLF